MPRFIFNPKGVAGPIFLWMVPDQEPFQTSITEGGRLPHNTCEQYGIYQTDKFKKGLSSFPQKHYSGVIIHKIYGWQCPL